MRKHVASKGNQVVVNYFVTSMDCEPNWSTDWHISIQASGIFYILMPNKMSIARFLINSFLTVK